MAFTLVETLVAVVVLCVGLLGLAATAAVVDRTISSAEQRTVVANLARSRLEQLAAINCLTMHDSSATREARGVTERWTLRVAPRAIAIDESIFYTVRGRRQTEVFRYQLPCDGLQ